MLHGKGKTNSCDNIQFTSAWRQQLWKQGLIYRLQTLMTPLCQGIAIRKTTDSKYNLYEFNLDKAISDNGLELLLKQKQYATAHKILNEQKEMLV